MPQPGNPHSPGCQCRPCLRVRTQARPDSLTPEAALPYAALADSMPYVYGARVLRTTMYFTAAQAQELELVSHTTGRTVASLVREACAIWLERRRAGHRTTVRATPRTKKKPIL